MFKKKGCFKVRKPTFSVLSMRDEIANAKSDYSVLENNFYLQNNCWDLHSSLETQCHDSIGASLHCNFFQRLLKVRFFY